ncbi:glutamate ABC transporter substrate-binding protein [Rhodococcus sp. NPDC049939]|uniref:glutamate ABC transporter substrate-binding protein n=1 Tax=Rhodococcus sp. NPDC049939 TaxID=3155511 RepID=UPI0034014588
MRRPRIALTLMALTLLVGACAEPTVDNAGSPNPTHVQPPLPAGATEIPGRAEAPPPPPEPNCGDPTASLRPLPASDRAHPTPTVDAIRARGRLIVGLDTGRNLLSFLNPTTGAIEGFDVDIAREISRDLFGDPDRIELRIVMTENREEALEESMVDVVVNTMTITCERREQVEFSTEYLQANQRILTEIGSPIRGLADLEDKRVCVVPGTTSMTRLQQLAPSADILSVPMWSDCLVVLQQRQVDAISTDDAILAGLTSQDPYLEIVGASMGVEPYGVGIKKENEDLVRFVNGTLERIRRDGTWAQIHSRWLPMLGPPTPPPAVYRD